MKPGEWRSPLSAAIVAKAGVSVSWPQIVGDDVWWVETRPSEGGRRVIVSEKRGDLIDAPYSASHTVHEMSGRSYLSVIDGNSYRIYFSNRKDQRIYLKIGEGKPTPITEDTNALIDMPNSSRCLMESGVFENKSTAQLANAN